MHVFRAELMYVPKPVGGARGGGGCLHHAHHAFPKKKNALSVHYVPTKSARTPVAHCVQERVACPSWGAPPQGPKTWVMLHHPCILGDPQRHGGENQNWWGPQVGGNATSPLHSRGSPKKGGQNQNWMPNPCLLGGPQVGGNATSPLHSRGSPTKGTRSKQKKKSKKKQKQKFSHGSVD